MNHSNPLRRGLRLRWNKRDALATLVGGIVLAVPVAAVLAALLGIANAADSRIPALGWHACYPLLLATRVMSWFVRFRVEGLDR